MCTLCVAATRLSGKDVWQKLKRVFVLFTLQNVLDNCQLSWGYAVTNQLIANLSFCHFMEALDCRG